MSTVKLLLDAVVEYLPAPIDLPAISGINPKTGEKEERHPKNEEPFSALAFKVVTDPHVGRLVYIRIYSGKIRSGEVIYNVGKQKEERIGKMVLALQKLSDEDPTFRIKSDFETGQTIISGMGELQLEILVDRMKREFGVEAKTGAPQVAYKETIKETAKGEGKYIRQTGGRGQYGHCFIRIEPKGRGEGYEFKSVVKGGAIPNEFISSIEKGVKEKLEKGIMAGFPMTDVFVAVYDGTYHDVDSSDMAFQIAGSMAVEAAGKKTDKTNPAP